MSNRFFLKIAFTLLTFVLFKNTLQAQLEKTIHQTFDVAQAPTIQLRLAGAYEIIPWVGDQVLSETHIQLFDASQGILDHFLETGRYEIIPLKSDHALQLKSKDMERRILRTKKGEVYEFVKIKLFVPDVYRVQNDSTLQLKPTDAGTDKG